MSALFRPPAPRGASEFRALFLALMGERNLLRLFGDRAFTVKMAQVPFSRRDLFIVNAPHAVRHILVARAADYPKSDVMVSALEGLVGEGIFISNGDVWQRQRRMIDPAFAHMRIDRAFAQMSAALDAFDARMGAAHKAGEEVAIDAEMSHLTADIIFRTIFSTPIDGDEARRVFAAFARYQDSVTDIEPRRLIVHGTGRAARRSPRAEAECRVIRESLRRIIDARLTEPGSPPDIAADIISARDPETGEGFTRDEIVDQIAVFFLAGHETSASVLSWALFILAQQPETLDRMRREIAEEAGDGPIELRHTKRMIFVRNVFRETLRLYPPVTFITRQALKADEIRGHRIRPGAMMVISPWLIHRHRAYWSDPDLFDPDRFSPEREREIATGTFIPFGIGPRVCSGAAFALTEGVLALARIARAYDIALIGAEDVMPVSRLTTRPDRPLRARLIPRQA